MRGSRILALTLASSLAAGCADSRPPGAEPPGKAKVPELSPASFTNLPRPIAEYLEQRGCMIPQSRVEAKPHNVTSGAFFGADRRDWAAYCLTGESATLLVFKEGTAVPAAELGQVDRHAMLAVNGQGEFPRRISAAGREEIQYYQQAFGGELPPKIDHQGIEDYYDGKASVIHYFHDGRWLELTGMD